MGQLPFLGAGHRRQYVLYQAKLLSELDRRMQVQFSAIESLSLSVSRNNNMMEFLIGDYDSYNHYQAARNMTATLTNLTFSMPIIFSMHLYMHDPPSNDPQGPVQYFPMQSIAVNDWYAAVEGSDFVWIGEHHIESYLGRIPVICFARKLYSKGGVYKGVLLLNIKASAVQNMLKGQDDTDSKRLLLDSGGRVITSIGFDGPVNQYAYEYGKLIQEYNRDGHSYTTRDSAPLESSFVVWSNLAGSGWLLIEVTPWDKLTEGSRHMAIVLISIGVGFALLILSVIVYLNRQFTRPIYLMLSLMKEYPFAKKETTLPNDYRNEFGQLFRGYRTLIARIEELYRSLERQYQMKREAEIRTLQAAINPHFLYNTLDQVNWMAIKDGNNRMSRVLELTGKMLRIGLSNGESLITLAEELDHVECYMEIQQIRLEDKIRYHIHASEPLLQYYVPKLTLQPFVENSIKHGFHNRTSGFIDISIHECKEQLIVCILDDGNGFNEAVNVTETRNGSGYGIRNVRERMAAFFGSDFSIDITNAGAGGTMVTIRLPRIVDNIAIGRK
jgi:two-component system sensor histidine kinase YesM